MHSHLLKIWCLAIGLLLSPPLWADLVKKSSSGLCHPPESSYFERTKNYESFDSVKACLESGGHLPKSIARESDETQSNQDNGYARSKFGHGWADEDSDCQNSRMEALISLSTNKVRFATDRECRVVAGRWISPFTGDVIHDASKIDVDHVVPMKWAWEHGADAWTQEKRETFANDLRNLWPVEASLNRSKGARGPDEWLPPSGKCQYVSRFFQNLKRYSLRGETRLRHLIERHCR